MIQKVTGLIFQLFKQTGFLVLFIPAMASAQGSDPKLIRWKSLDCDDRYDPYQLVDRISALEARNGNTTVTIHFAENCCAQFNPEVKIKDNDVFILPYPENQSNPECDCNCCFSLELEISNIAETEYQFFFKGKPIKKSDDPYPVLEPSQQVYQGQIINKRNKYGFGEGLWVSFYPGGQIKQIFLYPEEQHYREQRPVSRKVFYESGKVDWVQHGDTTEFWFEDGELKRQFLQYKAGDTTYSYRMIKHDNRKMKEKALERDYPTIFRSDLDPKYKAEGSRHEVIFREEYYDNGQVKYRYGRDTTYAWFANGALQSKDFVDGGLEYDSTGTLVQQSYNWKKKGPSLWGDLNHYLYVSMDAKGAVSEVNYRRDEVKKDAVYRAVSYEWKWKDSLLVQSPKKWKGELPWERFKEIKTGR